MSVNLIAILLSLAMMLTGAGGEGKPAEAARSLVLRNINVTYNGNALRLAPQARVGVASNGEKAVFDFGVDLDGEKLMPVQLGVSDAGVTALFAGSDVSVHVPAQAIDTAMAQVNEMLNSAVAGAQAENPELLSFLTEEFIPAYTGVIEAAMDPQRQAEIQAACKAVFDKQVDRGEGKATTAEIGGDTYDVTAYSYTIEGDQWPGLVDAVYGADPVLASYSDAMFRLYGMMPEESGLKDVDSYAALFEKFGLSVTVDIDEQINEKLGIDVMDAVLTFDMGSMVTSVERLEEPPVEDAVEDTVEDAEETADAEAPAAEESVEQLQPLVMNLHTVEMGDYCESSASFGYDVDDGQGVEFSVKSTRDSASQDMEMDMTILQDGRKTGRCKMSGFLAQDGEGNSSYSLSLRGVSQDQAKVDAAFYGMGYADGTSENSVVIGVLTPEGNVEVSFDLNVTSDPIEDLANAAKPTLVIDDLSSEALEELGEDQAFTGAMMKVMGSLSMDASKLTGDAGVQKLMKLMNGDALPIDVDDIDDDYGAISDADAGEDAEYTYVIDDEDAGADDAVVDDGKLGFNEPKLTWLPEGWQVASTDADTAYDWVEMSILDENGEECAYAIFFADPEESAVNYVVAKDGKVVEGREINVTDFGEGGLSVTLRDSGLYANMMFASEAIELDDIGRIVAGIEF